MKVQELGTGDIFTRTVASGERGVYIRAHGAIDNDEVPVVALAANHLSLGSKRPGEPGTLHRETEVTRLGAAHNLPATLKGK